MTESCGGIPKGFAGITNARLKSSRVEATLDSLSTLHFEQLQVQLFIEQFPGPELPFLEGKWGNTSRLEERCLACCRPLVSTYHLPKSYP